MKKQKVVLTVAALLILNFYGWTAVIVSKADLVNRVDKIEKTQLSKDEQLKITQLQLLSSMTTEQYEKLTGKRLNFFQKLTINASKKRMKNMLKHYSNGDEPTVLEKISWFGKGLLLGPIALLAGYIFLKDDERELIKWIWFGFAGFAVILAIILLA